MSLAYTVLTAIHEFGLADPQTGDVVTTRAVGPLFSFASMGVMAWPMTFCALMVCGLAAVAAWRLNQGEPEEAILARSVIDGSIFWGAYALALGILGTVVGFMIAAQSIEAFGRVEAALVWGGVKVALSTTVYGLLIFLVAALLWLGLRQWHRTAVLSRA